MQQAAPATSVGYRPAREMVVTEGFDVEQKKDQRRARPEQQRRQNCYEAVAATTRGCDRKQDASHRRRHDHGSERQLDEEGPEQPENGRPTQTHRLPDEHRAHDGDCERGHCVGCVPLDLGGVVDQRPRRREENQRYRNSERRKRSSGEYDEKWNRDKTTEQRESAQRVLSLSKRVGRELLDQQKSGRRALVQVESLSQEVRHAVAFDIQRQLRLIEPERAPDQILVKPQGRRDEDDQPKEGVPEELRAIAGLTALPHRHFAN